MLKWFTDIVVNHFDNFDDYNAIQTWWFYSAEFWSISYCWQSLAQAVKTKDSSNQLFLAIDNLIHSSQMLKGQRGINMISLCLKKEPKIYTAKASCIYEFRCLSSTLLFLSVFSDTHINTHQFFSNYMYYITRISSLKPLYFILYTITYGCLFVFISLKLTYYSMVLFQTWLFTKTHFISQLYILLLLSQTMIFFFIWKLPWRLQCDAELRNCMWRILSE